MQNGPPYEVHVDPVSWGSVTWRLPPSSLAPAHLVAGPRVPKLTETMRSGWVPAHDAALYESQRVLPGAQKCPGFGPNADSWPISQTNELGASWTMPHLRAFPIRCTL